MPQGFLKRIMLLLMVFATTFTTAIAQETKQGLARPEWQLRADLEFRLACQSSLQKLCMEVIQTHQKDPTDLANLKFLTIAGKLLETTDGKLPTTLPEHPSSIEYVKARKAAVIEWNKAYKAKGRDLPAVALDSERKFQEAQRDFVVQSSPSKLSESKNSGANGQPIPSETDSENTDLKQGADEESNSTDKKLENKLSDSTVKNAANLIKEIARIQSTSPSGETTFEKQASSQVLKRAVLGLVEKQPEYFFTYPIKDVVNSGVGLTFLVEPPMEFEQLQKALGAELLLISNTDSVTVATPAILKKAKSIKPGDLLRVRFKIDFGGNLNINDFKQVGHLIKFGVADPLMFDTWNSLLRGTKQSQVTSTTLMLFVEKKSIVEFQVIKQPVRNSSSP